MAINELITKGGTYIADMFLSLICLRRRLVYPGDMFMSVARLRRGYVYCGFMVRSRKEKSSQDNYQ